MRQTFQITISGQVQGVGFRPFVYGLAHQFQFKGSVCNNEDGVLIHLNSTEEQARIFLKGILKDAPAISIIQSHSISLQFVNLAKKRFVTQRIGDTDMLLLPVPIADQDMLSLQDSHLNGLTQRFQHLKCVPLAKRNTRT